MMTCTKIRRERLRGSKSDDGCRIITDVRRLLPALAVETLAAQYATAAFPLTCYGK